MNRPARHIRVFSWTPMWALCLWGFVAPVNAAQRASGPEPPASVASSANLSSLSMLTRDASGAVTLHAVPLAEPLLIDGKLDEAVYGTVAPLSDFVQVEPQEGQPSNERTELWLAFDANNVFVTFRCFESEPTRVVAKEMRRDNASIFTGDDNVSFFFDTYFDHRNGFEFTVNSIGGRVDGQTFGERQWIGDWNAIWSVAVGRFEGGWTVEAAIPFKSLRYPPSDNQTWGFNAFRTNRWRNELSFLVPVPKERGQSGLHMASLAAPLVGILAPSGSRNLELKPFLVSSVNGQRTTQGEMANDVTGDVGADVKYGITENLTADLTYNTDFAQVEADQQQVNLTRFSLLFPEKREFFLENAGTFQFGGASTSAAGGAGDIPILFYSRRIGLESGRVVPIDVGGRVTGRVGRYEVGLLDLRTGDDASAGVTSQNFSVLRVKRDVLSRSSIGLMATGRTGGLARRSNIAYGVDGAFLFLTNLSINTFWARSDTGGRQGDDTSYRGQLSWPGDRYTVQFERLRVGTNFDPGIGYVRRTGIARTYAQTRFTPRPRDSRVVRKYLSGLAVTLFEDGAGRVESREQVADVGIEFQNADRFSLEYSRFYELLTSPFRFPVGVTLPVGGYSFDSVRAAFNRSVRQRVSGNVFAEYGSFYNGHKTEVGVGSGRLNIVARMSLEPTYSVNRVTLLQGSFTTHLAGLRATWTATPLLFASGLVQYNSDRHALSVNARLRWEYRPGSELFVVYNEERDTLHSGLPELANRAFIVKVNRLFRF